MLLLFSFWQQKEKSKQKRKTAGSRSGAKNRVNFLNKKNSLSLKQLFVLHGNSPDFLYAPPLNAGPPTSSNGKLKGALLFKLSIFFCFLIVT